MAGKDIKNITPTDRRIMAQTLYVREVVEEVSEETTQFYNMRALAQYISFVHHSTGLLEGISLAKWHSLLEETDLSAVFPGTDPY